MKIPLRLISLFIFFNISGVAFAQDAVHIAIIPFTAADNSLYAYKDQVQAVVTACFANKNRFLLLDRGQTDRLKRELEGAKENTSAYSKVVAEQGHQAGAEYIITGVVSEFKVISEKVSTMVSGKSVMVDQYHGSAHLFLQINRVETGQVAFSKPINVVSRDFDRRNDADIIDNLLCRLGTAVQVQVRDLFPVMMAIVSVDKFKKNGLPDRVLVSGGNEMFDDGKKEHVCPGDDDLSASSSTLATSMKSLGSLFTRKKIMLQVISNEPLVAGGKTYMREKIIGELKMESVEGELAVCSVSSGEKEIKDFLDTKKPLIVRIKKDDAK